MKYKALFLSLLMILPLVAIAMPVQADINGPVMWINPNAIVKEGPCLVSSTFQVEVKLWNKKDLTGVGVYGFDFTVSWDNSIPAGLICPAQDVPWFTLMDVEFTSPWDHFFVIVDELSDDGTSYHLAITALDGSDALTEVQVVLATLTFHIDCEPLYPDVWTSPITLTATLTDLVDGKPVDVPLHEIDSGTVTLSVAQPDVYIAPEEFCEFKVDMPHTIEFFVSNINKVYGFGFAISYPSLKLHGDVQSVVISDCFPPPYEYIHWVIMPDTPTIGFDTMVVEVVRPCEKPSVTHCDEPLATFSLTSIYDFPEHMIPLCQDDVITLEWAYVLAKCGCAGDGETVTYYYNTVGDVALDVSDLAPIAYYWRPRIGDLNLDGAVDIQDLQALAAVYGELYGPAMWGDLDNLGNYIVDIYDFAMVAKYFGKPYVCDPEADILDVCWPN
jgi:hypothetical protein